MIRRSYFGGRVRGGYLVTYALVGLLGLVIMLAWPDTGRPASVSLSEVDRAIADGQVVSATIDDDARSIVIERSDGSRTRAAYPSRLGAELARRLLADGAEVTVQPTTRTSIWVRLAISFLPLIVIVGIVVLYMRHMRSGASAFARGRGREAEVPATRFSDVGGMDEVVAELAEARDFLVHPEHFAASGARAPRGFLLTGPPGTGKTLLARAVAGEAGVPFFAMSGSDFVETFAGVGAARVRRLFQSARKHERAIVFIDEIDAVGKSRNAGGGADSDERERTLNQLLVEMDGFTASNVIVLAATNRADLLDPALLRPGRFDRTILVPPPDRRGRTRILEIMAARHELADDVDFVALARRTPGMTGADLGALVNEAALEAARDARHIVTADDLEAALATTVLGRERPSAMMTDRDRRIVAWHEAGHAVCALLLPGASDPVQVTIVSRGASGGATWLAGDDDQLISRSHAHAQLVVAMGGRSAEEILLDGDFTSGPSHDYAAARNLALNMVTRFGMSDRGVVHVGYDTTTGPSHEVDRAINDLLVDSLVAARALLHRAGDLLGAVAAELLAEETVHLDRLRSLAAECGHDEPGSERREAEVSTLTA